MTRRELMALASRLGARGATVAPMGASAVLLAQAGDPWGKEKLTRLSGRPPDYETPVALLDTLITPIERFYVRCHLPVPAGTRRAGLVAARRGRRGHAAVAEGGRAAGAAAGHRRPSHSNARATAVRSSRRRSPGIQWKKGAVGTARWTGARLADVLKRAGVKESARFVHMSGADRPSGTMPPFVRQVSIDKAMHPDTVIAYEMNGQPIPPVHGAPLRAIVPGWEGAYSMKWLNRLHGVGHASDSFWVATGYRYPVQARGPGRRRRRQGHGAAHRAGREVAHHHAARRGRSIAPGPIAVAGFAWAGEADIARVDVSDRPRRDLAAGARWSASSSATRGGASSSRFEAKRPNSYLILSRATDTNGDVQPAVSHWNPSGYLWNQYDSVRVEVK